MWIIKKEAPMVEPFFVGKNDQFLDQKKSTIEWISPFANETYYPQQLHLQSHREDKKYKF